MTRDTVRIPRTFYVDHQERDLPTPVAIHEIVRHVWIDRNGFSSPMVESPLALTVVRPVRAVDQRSERTGRTGRKILSKGC